MRLVQYSETTRHCLARHSLQRDYLYRRQISTTLPRYTQLQGLRIPCRLAFIGQHQWIRIAWLMIQHILDTWQRIEDGSFLFSKPPPVNCKIYHTLVKCNTASALQRNARPLLVSMVVELHIMAWKTSTPHDIVAITLYTTRLRLHGKRVLSTCSMTYELEARLGESGGDGNLVQALLDKPISSQRL